MSLSDEELIALGRAAERDEQLRKRLAGKDARKKEGRHVHGHVPFGYVTLKRGVMTPVEKHVDLVREIFSFVASGISPNGVARALNERGVPSPAGRLWSGATIKNIVTNRAYVGERYNVPNAHPAIVSPDLFDQASAALASRAEEWAARRHKGLST